MCLFLPSLPLTSLLSPEPTHPSYGGDEGGIKEGGSWVTSLCSRLFTLPLCLSCSLSIFFSLHLFFSVSARFFSSSLLLLPTFPPISTHPFYQISAPCCTSRSCHLASALVPMWVWQREVERDGGRERERWPCRRGNVSSCCHWVLLQLICSLLLSLSFTLLAPQWASTTEPLFSPLYFLSVRCVGASAWLDHSTLIFLCSLVKPHWGHFISLVL